MRGAVCAPSNRNQVVKRIRRGESRGKRGDSWILQMLQFMTRQLLFHLLPQIHWLFLPGHQSWSPSSPQTIHVACPVAPSPPPYLPPPAPQKEWPVISMVKFNPIHFIHASTGTRQDERVIHHASAAAVAVRSGFCVRAWQQPRFVLEVSEKDDGSATWSAKQ